MTEKHTPQSPAQLDSTDATSAKPVKGMPLVLGLSIGSIAVLLIVVFAYFM